MEVLSGYAFSRKKERGAQLKFFQVMLSREKRARSAMEVLFAYFFFQEKVSRDPWGPGWVALGRD
jgi:hypothetical protein